ncbi:hypothetical protein HK096_006824 [Nowakowskiella sp. JEL0078]|nr:hypothetical protein HK096_006824 [Nowakowskiella sp. JEL0078]
MSNYAWTTLVSTESYVIGAITLARSLRLAKSKYPLYVMHTTAIKQSKLDLLALEENVRLILVEPLIIPVEGVELAFARFSEVWTKMRAWDALVGIAEKACFLDADMLVLQNMDEVFDSLKSGDEFASTYACTCNVYKNPKYPAWWTPESCKHTRTGLGLPPKTISPEELAVALKEPNQIRTRRYFNTGIFVYRPSVETLKNFQERLSDEHERIVLYRFPEQDFLNEFYATTWVELDYVYNALKTMSIFHKDVWDIKKVKNIHYIMDKPWDMDMNDESSKESEYYELNKLWWNVNQGRNV